MLFTDGENNSGREPYIELERARKNGVRVYLIGVELQSNSSEQLAFAIPMTGGKYYNVRRTTDLEQALTDINEVEKGHQHLLDAGADTRMSHPARRDQSPEPIRLTVAAVSARPTRHTAYDATLTSVRRTV